MDWHDYDQNPETFKARYEAIARGEFVIGHSTRAPFAFFPTFMSEYGGIRWDMDAPSDSWGYGVSVKTEEEFKARYKGLTDALLDNEHMMGLCYTQLTDVEQECNGLLTYEREFKFDPAIFHAINTRKAKIEE